MQEENIALINLCPSNIGEPKYKANTNRHKKRN